jgi:hypothetical protein
MRIKPIKPPTTAPAISPLFRPGCEVFSDVVGLGMSEGLAPGESLVVDPSDGGLPFPGTTGFEESDDCAAPIPAVESGEDEVEMFVPFAVVCEVCVFEPDPEPDLEFEPVVLGFGPEPEPEPVSEPVSDPELEPGSESLFTGGCATLVPGLGSLVVVPGRGVEGVVPSSILSVQV